MRTGTGSSRRRPPSRPVGAGAGHPSSRGRLMAALRGRRRLPVRGRRGRRGDDPPRPRGVRLRHRARPGAGSSAVPTRPSISGMVAILVTGLLVAYLLILDGQCVLHASAVEVDGAAVAFLGRSGIGKSTMATLCCAAGARLVTDDVLRLDTTSGVHCIGRTRAPAASLARRRGRWKASAPRRRRPDGRRSGGGDSHVGARCLPARLATIVLLRPSRQMERGGGAGPGRGRRVPPGHGPSPRRRLGGPGHPPPAVRAPSPGSSRR